MRPTQGKEAIQSLKSMISKPICTLRWVLRIERIEAVIQKTRISVGVKVVEVLAEVKEVEANLKGSETMARPVEVVRKWEIINKYRDSQGQSNRIAQPGIDQIEPITQTSMPLTHK